MTTTQQPSPTTPAAFRRRAEQAFRRANPDAVTVALKWTRCNRVIWADGTPGFSGTIEVMSPGYRTRSMIATSTTDAISVR